MIPLFEGEGFASGSDESFAEGEGAAWPWPLPKTAAPVRESYVNLIPTSAGGTHDSGLARWPVPGREGFIELHSCCPRA